MLKSIIKIFSVSTIGKILGFIKIQLLTRHFGADTTTDVIIVVMNIFWFWSNEIIFSLFSNTLIPKLASHSSDKARLYETLKIFSATNFLALFFLFFALFFGKWIIFLFAPSATPEFVDQSVVLIAILAPLALMIPLTEIFTLHNQYKEKFFISALNMAVWNLMQIAAILIVDKYLNPKMLLLLFGGFTIFGYLLTSAMQMITSGFFKYFRFWSLFRISFKHFKSVILSNIKFFLSTVFFQINVYVNYAFLSTLEKGSITIYDITIKVPGVFQSLLLSTLTIIFFNRISNDKSKTLPYFWRFSVGIFLVLIPLLVISRLWGLNLLQFIYGRDVFIGRDSIGLVLVASFVNIYLMGKISLLIKAVIVNNRPNYLLICTVSAVILNAILNFTFVHRYGLFGVSITTLIVNALLMLFLEVFVFKHDSHHQKRKLYILDMIVVALGLLVIYL